jgi:hypothetical protein
MKFSAVFNKDLVFGNKSETNLTLLSEGTQNKSKRPVSDQLCPNNEKS